MIRVTIETTDNKGMAEDITGVDMEEMYHVIRQAVLACGFHPETVEEYFPIEER